MVYQWVDVNEAWGRAVLDEVLGKVQLVLAYGLVVVVHCNKAKHRTGAFCALLMAFDKFNTEFIYKLYIEFPNRNSISNFHI